MIGWLVIIGFAALSFFYSWWFLLGLAAMTLWKLNLWYFYSSRPWRTVHFPMMRVYASACGLESGRVQAESRDFDIRGALHEMLLAVNPKVNVSHAELIEREFERCREFYDESLIKEYLVDSKKVDPEKVEPLLSRFREGMKTSDNGLMVRLVIAAVIEEQFSNKDRGEYLFEVLTGRAK